MNCERELSPRERKSVRGDFTGLNLSYSLDLQIKEKIAPLPVQRTKLLNTSR